MFESDESFVAALHSQLGPALQVVADSREGRYDLLYTREDVSGRFRSEDFDRIHDDSLLARTERENVENIFRMGNLNFAIYTFDVGVVLQFAEGDRELFIVFDDAEVELLQVVELCSQWLRSNV
ncbi:hypothetical protein [Haladaptatus sp. NG-SE-30]